MRRIWWKAYFFLALALTIGGVGLALFFGEGKETAWWERIYIPLYVIQIIGLFGFVFSRRLGVAALWQLVFLASVAHEAWNLSSMASDSELRGSAHAGLLLSTIAASLVLQLPMLIGLFLYGFRCKGLWHGAS
jgi:hypothetical protein